ANLDVTLALSLSPTGDVYYLSQLVDGIGTLNTFLEGGSATLAGSAAIDLPITVKGSLASAFNLPPSAHFAAATSHVFDLTQWSIDTSGLDKLLSFGGVSGVDISGAWDKVRDFFSRLLSSGGSSLSVKIPGLNVSVDDILGILDAITRGAA